MNQENNEWADSVAHRIAEAAQYQKNIAAYQSMLDNAPVGEPPAKLQQWLSIPADKLPVDLPLDTVMLVAKYQRRHNAAMALRAEMIQQAMVLDIQAAHEAQIPAEQRETAIAEAVARRAAIISDVAGKLL